MTAHYEILTVSEIMTGRRRPSDLVAEYDAAPQSRAARIAACLAYTLGATGLALVLLT